MIRAIVDWLDDRTGCRALVHELLYERIPSGARFRYVTGSMLVFAFATQAITGIFLWMAYSPSSTTAYESVYYIQHEMTGGWLLRGLHHFMAQAMVVIMALHLLQVVWDGAYRPPREWNYWLGLVLMLLVLGLGLTGYLLPWDQKGYWATNVATNLMTLVPRIGSALQQLAVGGSAYGHHTLTRFFAMHAGVLPALLAVVLVAHVALFRRHGITAKVVPGRPDDTFWPRQVLFDAIACLALLVVVLLCVVHFDVPGLVQALRGERPLGSLGAELGAPADPSEPYSAARPEWYYLFLFQLLKYFPGSREIIGAIVIPGLVFLLLVLLPALGSSRVGHQCCRGLVVLLLAAVVVLTGMALVDDYYAHLAPVLGLSDEKKLTASREFLEAREAAERQARRAIELIQRRVRLADGTLSAPQLIPREGASALLRQDPLLAGPRLFARHCASCHDYVDPQGQSPWQFRAPHDPARGDGAPNLFGFASRQWVRGVLNAELLAGPNYFGNTAHREGRMLAWVRQHQDDLLHDTPGEDDDLDAIVAALSAQAQLPAQEAIDRAQAERIARGVGLIAQHCTRGCHRFGDAGQLGLAPDLTGYGSYEWMLGLVSDPEHERFYRQENDRMPSFAKDLEHPERNNVSVRELSLIVDWLRGDYYVAGAERPRLPHAPQVAEHTVRLARATGPRPIVGQPPPDPLPPAEQARQIFTTYCAACHPWTDPAGAGIAARQPSAPNLYGFGSRQWLAGLLDPQKVASDSYFGQTRHAAGEMVSFVKDNLAELDDEGKEQLAALVAALSAEAALPAQRMADQQAQENGMLAQGRQRIAAGIGGASCTDCHRFHNEGERGSAPDLTGWGSLSWLMAFISDPTHEAFYRDTNDRMPAFGKSGPGPTKRALLTSEQIELVARWLRGELP
jgi:ubiquinol-cytochrome c reductase cytochrome b subunit